MTPRNELASTGYCLANPGQEYLVYLPKGGAATVDLSGASGKLAAEWIDPVQGTATPGPVLDGGARRSLRAPFAGAAALYLTNRGPRAE